MTGDEKAAAVEKSQLVAVEKSQQLKEEKKPNAAPTEYKFALRPEEKPGLEGFLTFLWNKETGEVMGRTGMSWLKITVFYIIYYTCLAGFFIMCLSVFLAFLNDKAPMWDTEDSLIGTNPGMGYRPHPPDAKIESTLIWYRHGEANGNWNGTSKDIGWYGRLKNDLQHYHNESYQNNIGRTDGRTFVECGPLASEKPGPGHICEINRNELFAGGCTDENYYGYPEAKPCIMIKLNKIFAWEPTPYVNESQMGENVPEVIKEEFRKNIADGNEIYNEKVWLECHGENPGDVENLGPITYYPGTGFPASYYPYLNQEGYLSPIVFARLESPTKGVMISIECRAYDQLIVHNSQEAIGLVHFELMID